MARTGESHAPHDPPERSGGLDSSDPNYSVAPFEPAVAHESSKSKFKKKKVVLQDQSSTELSTLTKTVIFCGLGLSLFLSFLDSTSVATAAPIIAKDLGAGESISWVGTSYLVAK